MSFSPDRCAITLLGARRAPAPLRQPMAALAGPERPASIAEAAEAQAALFRLSEPGHPAGFKIAATSARMQTYIGLDGPAAGFMTREGLQASGSTLAFGRFLRPGVECEIAVLLARALPSGPCTQEQAAEAVGAVMAGIELVENRYEDLAGFGAAAMVADQMFHAAAVLGTPLTDWRGLDLGALEGVLSLNGTPVASGFGHELLGHPLRALAWLAGSAEAAAFGGLRAGQIVLLGSVCPPVWLEEPAEVEVRFPQLDPVSVSLVAS